LSQETHVGISQRSNEAPPRSEEECEIWQEDTIKSQKSSGLALQSHFQNDSVKVGNRTTDRDNSQRKTAPENILFSSGKQTKN